LDLEQAVIFTENR